MKSGKWKTLVLWAARAAVAAVCVSNLSAAIPFVLNPGAFARGFEVSGVGGNALVRALGMAFLMWQVAFLPVIWNPRNRTCFMVILAMQIVGLAGETWMALILPDGHAALLATGQRFIVFDAAGLAVLAAAYAVAWLSSRRANTEQPDSVQTEGAS